MSKSLIIVESPTKARTFSKYLGRGYAVMASVGHVKDLPENKLGVDIQRNFTPQYVTIKGKAQVLAEIKKKAKEADKVYLAPDPDREGEAIAWHIAQEIDGKAIDGKAKGKVRKVFRVLFNEITESAIKRALQSPGQIDMNLVNAQQARRVLDRIVGYQGSQLLWKKVRRGLSMGRVQSVAVNLICEREREREAFRSEEYGPIRRPLPGRTRRPSRPSSIASTAKRRTSARPRRPSASWRRSGTRPSSCKPSSARRRSAIRWRPSSRADSSRRRRASCAS